MNKIEVIAQNVVMQKSDSAHNYFGWPSIAKLKDGTLIAGASGFRIDHVCPFGKAVICFSRDEGKTWSDPVPVIDTPLDDRDAGLLVFGERDVLVTSFNNSIEFQRLWLSWREENLKKMEGETARREAAAQGYVRSYLDYVDVFYPNHDDFYGSTYRVSHDGGETWGALGFAPITCPHGPLLTREGKIIYIGTPMADIKRRAADPRIRSYLLDPDAMTCEPLGIIPSVSDEYGEISLVEPHAIELTNGDILVHIRAERRKCEKEVFTIYQTISTDGGRTFPTPTPISLVDADWLDPTFLGSPPHIIRHSSGKLLCLVGVRDGAVGVRVLVSEDEGASWRVSVMSDGATSNDIGYPATAELSDGSLYTVWYERPSNDEPATIRGIHWKL